MWGVSNHIDWAEEPGVFGCTVWEARICLTLRSLLKIIFGARLIPLTLLLPIFTEESTLRSINEDLESMVIFPTRSLLTLRESDS